MKKPINRWLIAGVGITVAIIINAAALFFGVFDASPTAATSFVSAQTPEKDLKIKGNRNSKIYHLPGCASYDRIAANNIVWFKTSEEAENAGYRMAKNC